MIKPNEKEESFAKALRSNQMRLSERRNELRIKRLTLTVTKTVGKIPAEPPLGINAKGVEMTSNINQTMTKLNDVKQVSES